MNALLSFLFRFDVMIGAFIVVIVPYFFMKAGAFLKEIQRKTKWPGIKEKKQQTTKALSGDLQADINEIDGRIGHSSDVSIREFVISLSGRKAALIYIDGLADKHMIHEHLLTPLMKAEGGVKQESDSPDALSGERFKAVLLNRLLPMTGVKENRALDDILHGILTGSAALIIDGFHDGIMIDVKGWKSRSIEEPITESLVRGPRVGFVENLRDNTAILRRLSTNPNLTMIDYQIGKMAKACSLVYIKGIAEEELIEEVTERINKINLDNALESGYIEELIEDNYLSFFPQVQNTERPDRVMGALLEGRVAILMDGTPFTLIVPVTFPMFFQTPEDYYERWLPMSLIRMLRFTAGFISVFLPSIYIAFVSFHQGMIPTKLALSIASTRIGVPFPSLIEAILMEVSIEILREAGLRLPKPVGQTVGLVGGLVIGEAAVQANLVSPIMVIVVALTAISSFAIPQYGTGISLRILRFVAMFCSAIFGLYGILLFLLVLCIHFSKLESFGVPYFTPANIFSREDLKDFLLRMPLFTMIRRPEEFSSGHNRYRRKKNRK
ncbi:spore germination protein [Bacillus paralicheniformis]|nr:spore germination protein [Bacillus paralicheniformis]MPQ23696.1 spore germination protein [Bacillus paralicheniformis]